jgi:hypothetical protein
MGAEEKRSTEGTVLLKLIHPVTAWHKRWRPPGVGHFLPFKTGSIPPGSGRQTGTDFSGQNRKTTPCPEVHRPPGVDRCSRKSAGCPPWHQNNRMYQLQIYRAQTWCVQTHMTHQSDTGPAGVADIML